MTQIALYRHFDGEGQLLYVGCSQHPVRRNEAKVKRSWAHDICRIEIEWFPSKREALDAELVAIQFERPKHNGTHRPGRGRKGPRPAPPDNAASRIVKMFGGAKVVAEVAGVHRSRVLRWTYPKDRCGHDGIIPAKYQAGLIDEARHRGIDLRPEHFFEETGAAQP